MLKGEGLEYEVGGTGEKVLLIHGAIVGDSFVPVMREPVLAGYELIRYRRRGFGESVAPSSAPSIGQHASDAKMLLGYLGVDHAHVVAHSGGGPIAVQLAIDEPQMVRSLTLLEPALQNAEMAALFDERVGQPLIELHHSGESSKAVHLWMRAGLGSEWRAALDRVVPGVAEQANRDAAGTFDGDLPAMRDWDFDAVGVERIAQSVLDVVGSSSPPVHEQIANMLRAAVPQTQVVIIPEGHHLTLMTEPALVAAEIATFLGDQP